MPGLVPGNHLSTVMPGFMPGIHVLRPCNNKDVDGRNKSGHDELKRGCLRDDLSAVMPGLVLGIHVLTTLQQQRPGWYGSRACPTSA
jgi:hypothetical protein